MAQQIGILIDLLGFSEAVLSADNERTDTLLRLIQKIATLQGKFNLEGEPMPDGSYRFHGIRPEVTTFSDLLFASFPLPEIDPVLAPVIADMWLQEAERWVGVVAAEALDVDLLVRGGVAVGDLFHDQATSITFGKVLVEAHALESRCAKNPRILLSTRLCSSINADQRRHLLADTDGKYRLNYFKRMFAHVAGGSRDAGKWADDRIAMMDKTIIALKSLDKPDPADKWIWYRNEFVGGAIRERVLRVENAGHLIPK